MAVEEELKRLIEDGSVYVFRVPRFWGSEELIYGEDLDRALADDRVWHPRSMSVAKLPRLGLTDEGLQRFNRGEFGEPSPIAWIPDWFDLRTPALAEDFNEKRLAYAFGGTLVGCLLWGLIVGTDWIPTAQSFVNWLFPYGTGLMVFSILGLIIGALIGRAQSRKRETEWEFDPHLPVRAMDELGDVRF